MATVIALKPGETITVVSINPDVYPSHPIMLPGMPGWGSGGPPPTPGHDLPLFPTHLPVVPPGGAWPQPPQPPYPSHPIYNPGGPPGSSPPGFWGGGMGPGVKPQPPWPETPPPIEPPTEEGGNWVWLGVRKWAAGSGLRCRAKAKPAQKHDGRHAENSGVDDPADPDEIEDELEQLEEEGDVTSVHRKQEEDMPTEKEKADKERDDKLAKDTQDQALQEQRQQQVQREPQVETGSINEPAGSNITPEPSTPQPSSTDPAAGRGKVDEDDEDEEDEGDNKGKGKKRR